MALTTDELRIRDAARLEGLISALMAARRAGDPDDLDIALEKVVDFVTRTPFPELQNEARNAQTAVAAGISAVALEELAKIADRATAAGAGFKAAAMIAESGKKELLFPSLAATAARGLELLKQFRQAIDSVKATVGGVEDLGDVPQALEDLAGSFEQLKESVRAAEISESVRVMEAVPVARESRAAPTPRKKAGARKTRTRRAGAKKVARKVTGKKAARKKPVESAKTPRKTSRKRVAKKARKKAAKKARGKSPARKVTRKTGRKAAAKKAKKKAARNTAGGKTTRKAGEKAASKAVRKTTAKKAAKSAAKKTTAATRKPTAAKTRGKSGGGKKTPARKTARKKKAPV